MTDDDSEADGTEDCNDGCPLDASKITPGTCGYGVSDTEMDDDSIANCIDNCPYICNTGQEDNNGDGIGDACEPRPVKQWGRDDISLLLPTGDKKTDDRLKKAIEHIDKSLEDKYWADDSHLVEKGKKSSMRKRKPSRK